VIVSDRTDFDFKVEELNPKGQPETAAYDAIFHAPAKKE
jgi:hypothetical protein